MKKSACWANSLLPSMRKKNEKLITIKLNNKEVIIFMDNI